MSSAPEENPVSSVFETCPLIVIDPIVYEACNDELSSSTEADDLSPAIERGIKSGLPALINVVTNPDATSAATHAITAMMLPKEK